MQGYKNDILIFTFSNWCFTWFYRRNEDLKQMLESSKDSAKLDAMKRIVGVCDFFSYYFYLSYLFYYFLDVNTIFALQILYQVSIWISQWYLLRHH